MWDIIFVKGVKCHETTARTRLQRGFCAWAFGSMVTNSTDRHAYLDECTLQNLEGARSPILFSWSCGIELPDSRGRQLPWSPGRIQSQVYLLSLCSSDHFLIQLLLLLLKKTGRHSDEDSTPEERTARARLRFQKQVESLLPEFDDGLQAAQDFALHQMRLGQEQRFIEEKIPLALIKSIAS